MKKKDRKRREGQSGFTLIELMLVVVILGVLAAVVVGSFQGRGKDARIAATRASIDAICTAIDTYEVDTGRYPSSLQSLISSDGSPNWNGPYIRGGLPVDPWGHAFRYERSGDSFKVSSDGPGDGDPPITSS